MLVVKSPWNVHNDSGSTRLSALGVRMSGTRTVPHVEGVIDGDGDDRRLRQWNHKAPQHPPVGGPIQSHGLEQLVGYVSEEVHQYQHRQRDRDAIAGRMIAHRVSYRPSFTIR